VQDQPGLELVQQPPPPSQFDFSLNKYGQISELPGSNPGYAETEHSVAAMSELGYRADKYLDTRGLTIDEPPPTKSQKRLFGLRTRLFWAVIGLIVVIIIAAVVGGVVAAKNMNSKKQTTSTSASASASTSSPDTAGNAGASSDTPSRPAASATAAATSSGAASSATTTTVGSIKQNVVTSASGIASGATIPSLQTFSQDMSSGIITYRLYLAPQKKWATMQQASLSIDPNIGTPLAAVTQYDSSSATTFVNLFYLTGNSNTDIAQANMTCTATSPSCTITSNNIITTGTTHPVDPSSGLAAVYGEFGWRVYYSQSDGTIIQGLVKSSTWQFGIPLSTAKTTTGSSIAALVVAPSEINLFYVDQSNTLTTLVYLKGWKCKYSSCIS
jgi:cytoskeletal protein RodZ